MFRFGRLLASGALALLLLLALSWPSTAQETGAEDLESGGISLKVHAGYGNGDYAFALPVPNGALARQGAANTGMAWQLAYNHSVVPVQVSIEHRFPSAFKGRVEVVCRNSVSRSEASGNPLLTLSREVLVPPSTPYLVTLLPRVSPPVSPGSPVWLSVRLFQGENEKPISVERTYALQFEPYYLYTLHLDGAGEIVGDDISPGNRLDLSLDVIVPNFGLQEVSPQLLSSRNFCMPVPHDQVTGAPLAARDFAFVCADLRKVLTWTETDQAALQACLQGGGHLCLYNCAGQSAWLDTALVQPGASGRGIVLPVAGDFAAARQAMQGWLEGELSEFVLLSGGAVAGFAFSEEQLPSDRRLGARLNLAGLLGLYRPRLRQPPLVENANAPYEQPQWPPYEAGYLNPIWIYRESCRVATREPWDYPQFSQPNSRYLTNSYFNVTNQTMDESEPLDIPVPLNQLASAPRRLPWGLAALLALPILLALLSLPGMLRQAALRLTLGVLLLGGLSFAGYRWWVGRALPAPRVELSLIDQSAGTAGQLRRSLVATTRSGPDALSFAVPPDALLRRVAQNPAGDVQWTTTRPESWRTAESSIAVAGGADYVAMTLDVQEPADPQLASAIKVKVLRSDSSAELRIDTSALPSGSSAMLQSPLGWQLVPRGATDFTVHLDIPRLQAWPGTERLRQWEALWHLNNNGWSDQLEMAAIGEQSRLLLALRGQLQGGMETLPRLAWLGVMAQPLSGLAAVELASGRGQAVIWIALPDDQSAAPGPDLSLRFLRYSFPLEPAP